MIENNFTSQMARLLRMETGVHITERLLKYDASRSTRRDLSAAEEDVLMADLRHL